MPPFQGFLSWLSHTQGVALGWQVCGPLALIFALGWHVCETLALHVALGMPFREASRALCRATYFFPKSRFMFASPFTAMSSRFGSIFLQIAAARAMTFTSVVKDSMTISPL